MRKLIILILLAIVAVVSVKAQTEATKKLIEVTTKTVSTIDGSLSNAYRKVNRYDRFGRQIEWVQYSADSGSYDGGEFFTYDADGHLVSDVTSTTQWTFTYGDDGRVTLKTKYTAGADGTFAVTSYQYVGYDEEGRVLYEANHSTNGQLTDSVRYNYEGALLMTTDTYMQSGPATYSVMKRVRYTYNAAGKVTRSLQMSVWNDTESITRGNGYKYDEQNRLVADTVLAADADPRYLTLYQYEGDASESCGNEYYRISSDGWMKSEVRTNVYGTVSSQRTPTLLSAIQTSANGSVAISVEHPAEKTGYQGYKIIVDHQEHSTLYTAATAEISLRRGIHDIRVVAVYDGVEANTSDPATVDVSFLLPPVTEVKVRTMEYKYSWTLSVGWNAPTETEGLHLTGYRVVYPTPWGYTNSTTTRNLQTTFSYAAKGNIEVEVYAVYEEGEADAAVLSIDLTDTNRMVTEHWHNAAMTLYEDDVPVVTEHYYYQDNNGNISRPELLSTTVAYAPEGAPLSRYVAAHMENNYAKLIFETTDRWNKAQRAWEKYELVEYVYNSYNLVEERITRRYDAATDVYVAVATEVSAYDDAVSGTMPAETCYYTVEDDVRTLVERRTFVHYMDAFGIQRMETATVSDAQGTVTAIVKTYSHATTGSEVHRDSVMVFSPAMELVKREWVEVDAATGLDAAYVVCDAEGRVLSKRVYEPSKEYHPTHIPTALAMAEGRLTWTAPQRTEGLEGYRLLIDDVERATIAAGATEYEVTANVPSGMHDFVLVPLYDGAEATASGTVSAMYENQAEMTLAEAKSATVTSANRNTEFTITDEVMVTGVVGGQRYVECGGVGMMIAGIDAAEGDVITDIVGYLTKNSYAKNSFTATSYVLVSSGNEVVPLEVGKEDVVNRAEELDGRLISVKHVAIDAAAASDGFLNMTVTAAQNATGMNLTIATSTEYVAEADIEGYITVRTGAMASMSEIKVKSIAPSEADGIHSPIDVGQSSPCYDLSGRRVKDSGKGVAIKQGRIVIR